MAQGILDFMKPTVAWKPPSLTELPSWKGARRVAFDIECRDEKIKALGIGVRRPNTYICGYSFAIEGGPAYYVPMRHALGGNVADAAAAWRYVVDQLRDYQGTLVTNGGAYDLDYAQHYGAVLNPAIRHADVQLNEALINEWAGRYDLDSMLERYGLAGKDEELLKAAAEAYGVDPKGGMWKMPGEFAGAYGLRDVTGPLELLAKQEVEIDKQNLWRAVETESRLLPVVVRMRRRGVKIDMDRLEQFGAWAYGVLDKCFLLFTGETGVPIGSEEFNSPVKLDKIVKQVTGQELPRTGKGNPKHDEDTIKSLRHPAFKHLAKAMKLKTTIGYYKGLCAHVTNGRIHTTFKQLVGLRDGASGDEKDATTGAAFGRMASSHINMQNVKNPEKDPEVGGRYRSIFVPDEHEGTHVDYAGKAQRELAESAEWVCADYSQQEPRWVIHWAVHIKAPGARQAAEMLLANPKLDPYAPMVQDTGLPRDVVKIVYLALTYGMADYTLCQDLGLPLEYEVRHGKRYPKAGAEGRAIIDRFHQRAPYIKAFADAAIARAKERGYVLLWDDRRCRFLRDAWGNVDQARIAPNRVAQGNAGVQTKLALIEADRCGLPLQLVVHDDISLSGSRYRKQLVDIMQDVVKLHVPMRAKEKCGADYAAASGYGGYKVTLEDGTVEQFEFRPVPKQGVNFMESFEYVKVPS